MSKFFLLILFLLVSCNPLATSSKIDGAYHPGATDTGNASDPNPAPTDSLSRGGTSIRPGYVESSGASSGAILKVSTNRTKVSGTQVGARLNINVQ